MPSVSKENKMFILITVLLLTTVIFFIAESGSGVQFETSSNASNELQADYADKRLRAQVWDDMLAYDRAVRQLDSYVKHLPVLHRINKNGGRDAQIAEYNNLIKYYTNEIKRTEYIKGLDLKAIFR